MKIAGVKLSDGEHAALRELCLGRGQTVSEFLRALILSGVSTVNQDPERTVSTVIVSDSPKLVQQCFTHFERGKRPVELVKDLGFHVEIVTYAFRKYVELKELEADLEELERNVKRKAEVADSTSMPTEATGQAQPKQVTQTPHILFPTKEASVPGEGSDAWK